MKKLIILLSLLFIPTLNAQTYYDYEKIEVEDLPTASADTLNKVYIKDSDYYITKKNLGKVTSLPFNEDLKGKTIYFNFPTEDKEFCANFDSFSFYENVFNFAKGTQSYIYAHSIKPSFGMLFELRNPSLTTVIIDKNCNSVKNFGVVEGTMIITSWYSDEMEQIFEPYISITPIEDTFSWVKVEKKDVLPVIQNDVYVPNKNLQCYILKDKNTLRGYFSKPYLNSSVEYYDFFIDQHYNSIKGTEEITEEVTCLDNITYDYLYRNDIVEVLVFFVIVLLFVIVLPIKILFRLFRRFN